MLIFNPKAGKMQAKNNLFTLIDLFTKNNYEITTFPTQYSRHAVTIVKEKASHFDIIICCGGDGTLNEVVSGLMQQPSKVLLGYIPTGTTNDLATSLNISKDIYEAANDIINGKAYLYDIGSLNDKFFTYIAAFGAFTKVPYTTPQKFKNAVGRLSYFLEGVKHLTEIKSYHLKIECDDQVIEDDFVFGSITNSTSIAGFLKLNSDDVILNDGLFEVLLIKSSNNPIDLTNIVMGLLKQNYDKKKVLFFRTGNIKITSLVEIPWCLDGENSGEKKQVQITNITKSITFMLNK
ncbi:YegS/Rv2252/BmrU family lipid kinase [Natranaerovirga hydrolytica]|uniref:YegS/Rv2252/BmrU family lipid kinase n=2 Tax=Natranaerovirga hydrolytica TaxID=680378 RepID=A0A4R1MLN1_9FIRM|nr:YegS/Rv2252/BmrU family lipid kinase [Natranaerovirga hydrolytica]